MQNHSTQQNASEYREFGSKSKIRVKSYFLQQWMNCTRVLVWEKFCFKRLVISQEYTLTARNFAAIHYPVRNTGCRLTYPATSCASTVQRKKLSPETQFSTCIPATLVWVISFVSTSEPSTLDNTEDKKVLSMMKHPHRDKLKNPEGVLKTLLRECILYEQLHHLMICCLAEILLEIEVCLSEFEIYGKRGK